MANSSLYLIDDVDAIERDELDRWVRDAGGEPSDVVVLPDLRATPPSALEAFADQLAAAGDRQLTPLRVAWLPKERDGRQTTGPVQPCGGHDDVGVRLQRAIARHGCVQAAIGVEQARARSGLVVLARVA